MAHVVRFPARFWHPISPKLVPPVRAPQERQIGKDALLTIAWDAVNQGAIRLSDYYQERSWTVRVRKVIDLDHKELHILTLLFGSIPSGYQALGINLVDKDVIAQLGFSSYEDLPRVYALYPAALSQSWNEIVHMIRQGYVPA